MGLALALEMGVGAVPPPSMDRAVCGCRVRIVEWSIGWLVVAFCLLLGHSSGDILIYPSEKTNFAAFNQCKM